MGSVVTKRDFIADCLLYSYARILSGRAQCNRLPLAANTPFLNARPPLSRVRLPPRPGLDPVRVEAIDDHHGDEDHRANGDLVVGKDAQEIHAV